MENNKQVKTHSAFLGENSSLVNTDVKKCPNCGGALAFDIKSGDLKCGHCDFSQIIENNETVERRNMTSDVIQSKQKWDDSIVFRCDNCGAKEVLHSNDITKRCPFCASSNIVATEELSGIKPDSIIPFQITKDKAKEIFKKWMKSKKMSPSCFKTADIRENITQLYCPSWSFSSDVLGRYNGRLGEYKSRTVRDKNGNTTTERYTHWYNVSGNIKEQYTDEIFQSSDKISPINFSKLKPFDLNLVKPYRTEFISGIMSAHYSRDINICFQDYERFVTADLRKKVIHNHRADTVDYINFNIDHNRKRFNYLLLPLYIASYKFGKKSYNFFINGQSGKIAGKSPVSGWKVLGLTLLVGAVIAAGVYLAYKFL